MVGGAISVFKLIVFNSSVQKRAGAALISLGASGQGELLGKAWDPWAPRPTSDLLRIS